MRGLRDNISSIFPAIGITPAHAGLTAIIGGKGSGRRDHPRACGAYNHIEVVRFSESGSPPRMRGLLLYVWIQYRESGITPAHAGLTS